MTIAEYLSELEGSLRVGRRAKRRILDEIEAHLRDAAASEQAHGMSREEAERLAIDRLGGAALFSAQFARMPSRRLAVGLAACVALVGMVSAAIVLAEAGRPGQKGPGGARGNTLMFSYTAPTGGLKGGPVEITVPADWTTPSATASAGTVSISGHVITVSGTILKPGQTLTITSGESRARSCTGSAWCRFATLWGNPS